MVRILSIFFLSLVLLAGAHTVFAVDPTTGTDTTGTVDTPVASDQMLVNPLNGVNSLPEFLNLILKAVTQIGVVVLMLMLVYTGFLFVVAQGNEEKISAARNALLWTVIGGLVLLGASAISAVIQDTVTNLS